MDVLDHLADRLKVGITFLFEDTWFQSQVNQSSHLTALAIYDLADMDEVISADIHNSETWADELMDIDFGCMPDSAPLFECEDQLQHAEPSTALNLQRLGSTGQGAHQKVIRLNDSQHDAASDEECQADGEYKIEVVPPSENVAEASQLCAWEEESGELFPSGDMTISQLDAQFDQTLDQLVEYYGGSSTKFKRPRLVPLNKRERENLMKVYDFQITKEKREELDKIFKRNLAFIKTFEVMNRRIQSFLLKPFRLFSENL